MNDLFEVIVRATVLESVSVVEHCLIVLCWLYTDIAYLRV